MHLTSHITHSNGYAPYIAYYRSNGFDQRFRKLKPKPKLNPPNAHRSQIKICEKWHTHNVQFRFMPNAFRILKPIQKSSKRVWVFRNTGANAFAKNQMRLAYEDKRDLYCSSNTCLHRQILDCGHVSSTRSAKNRNLICPHSAQTTNPTNRHESINVRIREDSWNFANFLSKSWRSKILLRYRYGRVTNIRGIRLESLKYCHEFTIYKNRLRILHKR